MAKKTKARKRRLDPKQPARPTKAASRSGSNAGRGFRYQDAVSAWLAVEIWAGRRAPATLIPEGGDDVELRGEETTLSRSKADASTSLLIECEWQADKVKSELK